MLILEQQNHRCPTMQEYGLLALESKESKVLEVYHVEHESLLVRSMHIDWQLISLNRH